MSVFECRLIRWVRLKCSNFDDSWGASDSTWKLLFALRYAKILYKIEDIFQPFFFQVLDLFFKVHLTLDRLRKIMDDSVENALNYVFSIVRHTFYYTYCIILSSHVLLDTQ